MPERQIGSEELEASVKLRISSIDCLSAASFEAARSEQLRIPAEEPLKRLDVSDRRNRRSQSLTRTEVSIHGATHFYLETNGCCNDPITCGIEQGNSLRGGET